MSFTLFWEPKPEKLQEYFSRGGAIYSAIVNNFGDLPVTLCSKDLETLEIIMKSGHEDVSQLIDAIYVHGRIEVDASN